ncbi:hypothetical protein GQ55_4G319900 [Panicum hallii var. hallii]|uniref:Fe2OG dioxygenase domain-containing protein n=1 Tax=Panicum hallii var. hallii TaxID=1504633 RepID=A0A2T7E2E3_9POAL|nr:hypothetical protein GQ55_4G319900 [Panicum hallii var. hallii]
MEGANAGAGAGRRRAGPAAKPVRAARERASSGPCRRNARRQRSGHAGACARDRPAPAAVVRGRGRPRGRHAAVTDHGIETSLMDALIAASREFFRKPLEEKQAYSNLIEGKQWQLEGYGNDPVKSQDQILDWSDRLHLRVEPEDERNLDRWPGHPESFRGLLHEYTLSCKRVKDGILRAMARLLELDDDDRILDQFGDKGSTYARFNCYPACPRPDLVLGIRPHSDVCVLTLLLMDEHVAGLQVLRDGTWYGVPAARNRALLVNVGVSLEIMSNGTFRGPVHRVVTNLEKERMSLAMFYSADLEQEIEPIAELLGEKQQPARYRRIKCMQGFRGGSL